MPKLNLGCGLSALEGWDNYDNSPSVSLATHPFLKWLLWKLRIIGDHHYRTEWPADIKRRDLRRGLPYRDATVDCIYSSHLLEHLSPSDAAKLLAECYRVLRPGGRLRLAVPDLFLAARRYVERTADMLDGRSVQDRTAHDEFIEHVCSGYLKRVRSGHLYSYDYPTLHVILVDLGFREVVKSVHGKSGSPEMGALDCRPDDSVYVEATKEVQEAPATCESSSTPSQ